MSWLISLLIAGAMFSAENNLPVFQANNYTEIKNIGAVKADETERFEQTYPLGANGRVSVSNVNGSITIEGWDKPEVKLEYVKTADDREALNDIVVKIEAKPDYLRIETDQGKLVRNLKSYGGARKNYYRSDVNYHLTVPRNAVLDEIETVNGSVSISNTTNSAKVSAVNGEVKALNLSGAAELSTVNGTVTADFERLDNSSRISLETVNGRAFLTLPSDINATVRAETTNGKITNDFGLPVREARFGGNSNLYGKIGAGDAKIKLESVNGELSVRRRQDGKNPNPVTNLLSSKTDDEDFSGVMDKSTRDAIKQASKVKVNIPEINAEVQRAMAEAQREIARAKVNVNINPAEMQKTIKDAMEQQRIAMDNMRDAGWFRGVPSVERKSESFVVKGVPKVTIDAKNCAVFVRGWDKSEVQYTVTQISRSSLPLSSAQPSVSHTDSEVNIKIAENNSPSGNGFDAEMRLRVKVFVPRKSNLQIITNREVRLENVSGELNIQGGAEAVDVRDSDGNLSISTESGKVRVIGFKGAAETETIDGLMSLEGDFQKLSARAADGIIILTLPENADATIESNRRDISFEGVPLVYQGDEKKPPTWKIGRGSAANYFLSANTGGRIFVRSSNSMRAN